jgi:hypothetical protein
MAPAASGWRRGAEQSGRRSDCYRAPRCVLFGVWRGALVAFGGHDRRRRNLLGSRSEAGRLASLDLLPRYGSALVRDESNPDCAPKFFGRQRELADLTELVANNRLVTITAPAESARHD